MIAHLQRLDSYGVAFHSYTESHLSTDNELVRNILLAVLSSLAKVEAVKISERTKAGLEHARRRGAKIGRPQLEEGSRSEITQRLADGATPFAVARALGIDRKTVLKYAGHVPHNTGNAWLSRRIASQQLLHGPTRTEGKSAPPIPYRHTIVKEVSQPPIVD